MKRLGRGITAAPPLFEAFCPLLGIEALLEE